MPERLRDAMRAALLAMGDDAAGRAALAAGFVTRLAPVSDATYDDIRAMLAVSEAAGVRTLG